MYWVIQESCSLRFHSWHEKVSPNLMEKACDLSKIGLQAKITCNINDPKSASFSVGPTLQFGVLIRYNAAVGSTVQPPCLLYPQLPSAATRSSERQSVDELIFY